MVQDPTDAERSDFLRIFDLVRRFEPRPTLAMGTLSAQAFLAGLCEAALLALITSVAVTTAGSDASSALGPISLTPDQRLGLAATVLVVSLLLNVLVARSSARIATDCSLAARQQLLANYHLASFERRSRERVAVLQEALTTYVDRFTTAFGSLTGLISASLSLASFAATALLIDPKAVLALVVIGGLVFAVQRPTARRTKRASRRLLEQRQAYAEGATESVLLARELAVFGVAPVAGERLLDLDRDVAAQGRQTRFLQAMTPKIYQSSAFLLIVVALAVIQRSGVDDITSIAAVALLVLRSLSYGQMVLSNVQQLAEHRTYVDRLMALMEGYEAEPQTIGTVEIGALERIELQQVSFGYAADRPVVEGIDLVITAGETIGVVGPSGAGKTTLANLLLRLYEPTDGRILVNGVPLSEVDDREWHARTAIVPQEPRLVHGTIRSNIAFFRSLDQADLEQAAREANVAEFIAGLDDGYDAEVGELGAGLSGGQRQRICIARALAGKPDLLVLDEPTSALDGASEVAIQGTLELLKGRVTMVLVAHRLSTLAICDRIVVVGGGGIEAVGTPEELRTTSDYYRRAMAHAGL